MTSRLSNAEPCRERIRALGPWFHNLHLPSGEQTAPEHGLGDFPACKWQQVAHCLPEDMRGMRALDIGCNAGFYSFELGRRGADVLAIDVDDHYLAQARWAASEFGLERRITFRKSSVYDLLRNRERFDWVLFLGVFYHLRHPLLALDIVSQAVGGTLLFQTLTSPGTAVAQPEPDVPLLERDALAAPDWPHMAFIEQRLAGDPTNWWAPNRAAVLAMLRSSGLRVVSEPAHEFYLCEPGGATDAVLMGLARQELEAVARAAREDLS